MVAPLNEKSTLHNNFSHKRTAFRPLHVHSQTMKFLDFAFMSKMVRFYQEPVPTTIFQTKCYIGNQDNVGKSHALMNKTAL